METKAKQEFQKTLSKLLNNEEEAGELEEKAEILRLFLESTDFSKLRREYEKHLIAGRGVKFILHLVKGKPEYEIKIIQGNLSK